MNFSSRQSWKSPLLGALLISLCAANAQAKDTAKQAAARSALTAEYALGDKALLKKDLTASMAQLAPDYVSYMRDGTQMNRAQTEAYLRNFFATFGLRFYYVRSKIQKIQWRGPDAIVYSTTTARGSGNRRAVEAVTESRDYWRPTSRGWLISQSAELKSRTWVNGKIISAE